MQLSSACTVFMKGGVTAAMSCISFTLNSFVVPSLDCWRKPEKTNADTWRTCKLVTEVRSGAQDLLVFDIMMHLLKMLLC